MKTEITELSYHSISVDGSKCTGLMHCMRVCPAHAIRVRNGKAKIINDRCIDCGECLKVCKAKAITPNTNSFTDFQRFKYTIALPSPALYGQFPRDILPAKIQAGLLKLGFDEVADISDTCEAVSLATNEFLKDYKGPKPLISTACPTIVRLIQIKYPELIDNLLPIESPREIVAREIRLERAAENNLEPEDIGIIYITPCPSKMIDIVETNGHGKSDLDGAISISDIYTPLLRTMGAIEIKHELRALKNMSSYGISWAMLGGIARPLNPENWLGVSGIHDSMMIFSDIENRNIGEVELIECWACVGGCIGGSLNVENMYVARTKSIRLAKLADKESRWDKKKIHRLFKNGYFDKKKKFIAKPARPLDTDISSAIEKMKAKDAIYRRLPKIDCGACGSPLCSLLAEDVVLGHAKLTDCPFMAKEILKGKDAEIIKFTKDEKK